jgi:hypothetical protein
MAKKRWVDTGRKIKCQVCGKTVRILEDSQARGLKSTTDEPHRGRDGKPCIGTYSSTISRARW